LLLVVDRFFSRLKIRLFRQPLPSPVSVLMSFESIADKKLMSKPDPDPKKKKKIKFI
jgi:hypothetical protein